MRAYGEVYDHSLLLRHCFRTTQIGNQVVAELIESMRDATAPVDHVITKLRQSMLSRPVTGLCGHSTRFFAPVTVIGRVNLLSRRPRNPMRARWNHLKTSDLSAAIASRVDENVTGCKIVRRGNTPRENSPPAILARRASSLRQHRTTMSRHRRTYDATSDKTHIYRSVSPTTLIASRRTHCDPFGDALDMGVSTHFIRPKASAR